MKKKERIKQLEKALSELRLIVEGKNPCALSNPSGCKHVAWAESMKVIEDISTSKIAEILGVTMPFVSHVKKGRKRFSPEHARKLHKEFGIPLWELRPDIYPKSIFNNLDVDKA